MDINHKKTLNQNNYNKIATHKDIRILSKFKISKPTKKHKPQNNNYKRQQTTSCQMHHLMSIV